MIVIIKVIVFLHVNESFFVLGVKLVVEIIEVAVVVVGVKLSQGSVVKSPVLQPRGGQ